MTRDRALAYLQDFRLMMFVTLSALPLIFLLGKPVRPSASAPTDEELTAGLE
jgi:hypothetical protein